jgi:hypothetical protein
MNILSKSVICATALLAWPAPAAAELPHAGFDADAVGFVKARLAPRESITVEEPRSDVGFSITWATAKWNELAGWPLFVVSDAEVTDVRVWPNWPANHPARAAVEVTPDSDGVYLRCEIRYNPDDVDVLLFAHELGHCLGLLDHNLELDPARPHEPQCSDEDGPGYSTYRGIMADCDWPRANFGMHDYWTLEHYGYRP